VEPESSWGLPRCGEGPTSHIGVSPTRGSINQKKVALNNNTVTQSSGETLVALQLWGFACFNLCMPNYEHLLPLAFIQAGMADVNLICPKYCNLLPCDLYTLEFPSNDHLEDSISRWLCLIRTARFLLKSYQAHHGQIFE
jgi:hypothetical protein